jgi:hypothetical protein
MWLLWVVWLSDFIYSGGPVYRVVHPHLNEIKTSYN